MTDTKIFTEIGFGNDTFVSTEVETGDVEMRQPGFIKMKCRGIYLRLWVGHTVWIASTVNGFTRMTKPKKKFKFLLGFEGIPRS